MDKLNHAQAEWLRVAREAKSGFYAERRRSLDWLESDGYLDSVDYSKLPLQIRRYYITGLGIQALEQHEKKTTQSPVLAGELTKRQRDLLMVAYHVGRERGFAAHGHYRTLKHLVSFGLIEENQAMPWFRWWRITENGQQLARDYELQNKEGKTRT
jgi:hypothetical protein